MINQDIDPEGAQARLEPAIGSPATPEPPTFRILCEEIYARAVPPELLADPDYEWRIFPDLGGDYPILYVLCDGEYLPLSAVSEEGRAILGGIDQESLHLEAAHLHALRARLGAALSDPPHPVRSSPLFQFFAAIAHRVSQTSQAPFDTAAVADRILASRFVPDEIALDLESFSEDIAAIRELIAERESSGEEYWRIVADLLDLPDELEK